MEDVSTAYLKWVAVSSKYWSSYGFPTMKEESYGFTINALFVGKEEDDGNFWSLEEAMADVLPDKLTYSGKHSFDTFYDKLVVQVPESISSSSYVDSMPSVLLNSTSALDPGFSKMLVDNWIPRCYR